MNNYRGKLTDGQTDTDHFIRPSVYGGQIKDKPFQMKMDLLIVYPNMFLLICFQLTSLTSLIVYRQKNY